jgi:hypothetical protein
MANEKHLLLTAQGDYTDATLAAEGWQVGIRLALIFGSTDAVGTLPNDWDPTVNLVNRTETNWTISGNWHVVRTPQSFQPDDYLNDQAAPAFATWLGAISGMSSHTRLRSLKLSVIGTNGRSVPPPPYASGTPELLTWTSSYPVGSNSGNHLPLQVSAVASHRTGQTGRAGRGRMYLPSLNTGVIQSDGLLDSSWCTSTAGHQKDLLEALHYRGTGATPPEVTPIVTGSGYVHYGIISQVKVGNVPDTQRRRRRQIPETYQSTTVTY